MKVTLEVSLSSENAAFQDGMFSLETGRILRELAEVIGEGTEGMFDLRDINGNWVGRAFFEAWEEEEQE